MQNTRIRQDAPPQGTPEYLRLYHERLTANGVAATLPTARGDLALPQAMKLRGRPLSAVVRELREGE